MVLNSNCTSGVAVRLKFFHFVSFLSPLLIPALLGVKIDQGVHPILFGGEPGEYRGVSGISKYEIGYIGRPRVEDR